MRPTPVRTILAALAILHGLGLSALAQEHLIPERGSLNEPRYSRTYMKKLRNVLLEDAAVHHQARMVCCPSFDPEWAITVIREGETELFPGDQRDYFVEYVGAEKNLWYAKRYRKVAVKRARTSLDRETAEAVSEVWRRMLQATRHPEIIAGGIEDGVTFHFSRDVPPSMYRGWHGPSAGVGEGQIHEPHGDSVTGEFVALGRTLKGYALAKPDERDEIRSEIHSIATRLKATLDRQRQPG